MDTPEGLDSAPTPLRLPDHSSGADLLRTFRQHGHLPVIGEWPPVNTFLVTFYTAPRSHSSASAPMNNQSYPTRPFSHGLHGTLQRLWARRYLLILILAGAVGVAGLFLWASSALDKAPIATVIGIALTVLSLVISMAVALHQGYKLSEQGGRLGEILVLSQKLMFSEVTLQIFSRIQDNEKLNARMHDGQVAIKKGMGQAMHKLRVSGAETSLIDKMFVDRNVFIESGSTNAYLALQICERLKERGGSELRHYTTNNHLAYMTLITQPRCRVRLFPGCPSGKYGATFGRDFDQSEPKSFSESATGLELDEFLGDKTEVIMLAMSRLHLVYGPHVGSRENAQFKSLLLSYARLHNIPVVITIDYSKIEVDLVRPSTQGGCHPVYRCNDQASDEWTKTGFNEFCKDIANGLIFLLVGYKNASAPPLEVKTLKSHMHKFNETVLLNKGADSNGTELSVAVGSHPSESMGMLSVYAMDIEKIGSGSHGKEFARLLSQV